MEKTRVLSEITSQVHGTGRAMLRVLSDLEKFRQACTDSVRPAHQEFFEKAGDWACSRIEARKQRKIRHKAEKANLKAQKACMKAAASA